MNKIININEIKLLAINEHFIFGEYEGEEVEWVKASENSVITVNIVDCIVFNPSHNEDRENIMIRKWCNEVFGKQLGVDKDIIALPFRADMEKIFLTERSRIANGTEWAKMHGLYFDITKGTSPYWIWEVATEWDRAARVVTEYGEIIESSPVAINVGARPIMRLK